MEYYIYYKSRIPLLVNLNSIISTNVFTWYPNLLTFMFLSGQTYTVFVVSLADSSSLVKYLQAQVGLLIVYFIFGQDLHSCYYKCYYLNLTKERATIIKRDCRCLLISNQVWSEMTSFLWICFVKMTWTGWIRSDAC